MLPDFVSAQSHYQGASGRPMVTVNGHQMQGVHEYHIVMYAKPSTNNSTITLTLPEKTNMVYCRWYDYTTDKQNTNITSPASGRNSNWKASTDFGVYQYSNSTIAADATFTMPSGTNTQYIACDLSAYRDGSGSGSNFREPTLSYRVVYEIRPASQIANAIAALGNSDYLETHYITAPTDKEITLRLNHDNSSYFYNNNNNN